LRPQPVKNDAEQTVALGRTGAVRVSRPHGTHHQSENVGSANVTAHSAGGLSPFEQHGQGPPHPLLDGRNALKVDSGACQGVEEVFLRRPFLHHPRQEAEESGARVARLGARARFVHELLHAADDDRLEERFFRGKVPVERTHAKSGAPGDLVDGHGEPFGRKDLLGYLQHALAIALGVGP
jgi:hypothetical protein